MRVEGGATSDADALYAELNPEDPSGANPADSVNAGDFASNDYLNAAVFANLHAIQDSVNVARIEGQASALSSNSILAYMFGGGLSGSSLNILS